MKDIDFVKSNKPWIVISIALVAVIFYLYKCTPTPAPQITTTTKVLKDTVRLIEQDRKHLTDSFENVLKWKEKANYQNESDFIKLLNENAELAVINERLQQGLIYPDTCRDVVNKLNSIHGNYVSQTNKTIEQAKKSLIGLSQTVQTQKKYIDTQTDLFNRLKKVNDTCLSNSAAMERYIKKAKPKRELGLVVSGMNDFSTNNFKPAIGGGLSYSNKRRLQFVATYYSNQTGSISIIKPLFRF